MMMKKISALILLLSACHLIQAQSWKPAGNKIRSAWSNNIDPASVHSEYPRPQMRRDAWINLNGLWEYAIKYKEEGRPASFSGHILVPFAIESSLSGVGKTVGENNQLWYRRTFTLPASMKGKKILLNFGAVDWEAEVFINGKKAGMHQGGYDPFSLDITTLLGKGPTQEIVIRVWDPTDKGPQPRGKQVSMPHGIWYTPVTGIWQTVWVEAVADTYIDDVYSVPDLDASTVDIHTLVTNFKPGDKVNVMVSDQGKNMVTKTFDGPGVNTIPVTGFQPWSPDSPKLYDLSITLERGGKQIDQVKSYFAMRKISLQKDDKGIQWIMLNNKFLFQYGPLDQGWWPDGLYTAPSAEALKFDIEKTKAMGFNMIRKHVKVEPAIWYRYCDSLGVLVWQDMPSGDNVPGDRWTTNPSVDPTDKTRTDSSEKIYRTELKEMLDALRAFPSIVVWVPFNEAWGQFKTVEVSNWVKQYDPSRLANSASGGNFHATGDIHDLHNYPDPTMHRPEVFAKDRSQVLGEFGGLGLPVENHTWTDRSNWGYQSFKNKEELFSRYQQLIEKLLPLIPRGLSAAVYTQTTDVESEVNGLMTYDRKFFKFNIEELKKLNNRLYEVKK
jgi:beta-galactosidase/beta-glucuronidase